MRACVRVRAVVFVSIRSGGSFIRSYVQWEERVVKEEAASDAGGCWKETDDGARGAGERRGETGEDLVAG